MTKSLCGFIIVINVKLNIDVTIKRDYNLYVSI